MNQPRKYFDDEALADLSDSIRVHGIIQPLTVRRLASGYYQIIAGERRWRAARMAGLTQVPAVVIEADDRKVMELGLIENLQRQDLNPIEEANGYKVLMKDFGMSQEEVAQRVGKSRPAIANAVRLLSLPDPVRELLEQGKLSAGHARAILGAPSPSQQRNLAQRAVDEQLSVRQVEEAVKRMLREEEADPDEYKPVDPHKIYRDEVAKELSTRFGRKVAILQGAKKGKVEFEYYDEDDLNDLVDLLEQIKAGPKGGSVG